MRLAIGEDDGAGRRLVACGFRPLVPVPTPHTAVTGCGIVQAEFGGTGLDQQNAAGAERTSRKEETHKAHPTRIHDHCDRHTGRGGRYAPSLRPMAA
jgi:hypothetical protein